APVFPAEYSLSDAQANEDQVLALEDTDGRVYHAAAAVVQQEGDPLSIQMVALPLAEADRIISQYFGIYITIALIILVRDLRRGGFSARDRAECLRPAPVFPAEYSLSDAQANEDQVLALEDTDGRVYHA
ncbi:hypothetical protein CTI14_47875, partial [Methylobacterium radiotolerans]